MNNQSGFTLLELLTTLAIASILVVLSTSFSGVVKNNKLSTSVQDLVAALNLARSEAITRGTRIAVCKSDASVEPRQCVADGASSGWDQGWIVFIDVNNNQTVANPATNILRVYDSLGGALDLSGNASILNSISYASTGFPVSPGGGVLATGTFTLCDGRSTGQTARQIVINRTGHLSINPVSSADHCTA